MFGLSGFSATPFSTPSAFGPVGVKGVAATGGVGSVSINGTADAIVTGVSATASTGGVVFNLSQAVTGIAATSGIGSVTVSLPTGASVTGVSASMPMTATEAGASLLGGLAFSEEPFASLADGDLQISFQLGVGESVTGVAATSAVGSVTVTGPANVSVTGIAATGGVGAVTVDAAGQVDVTGLAATSAVGSVTVTQGTGVTVALTGSSATGRVGVASATGQIQVQITGLSATGEVGQVSPFAWNPIVPDQTANWVEIAA